MTTADELVATDLEGAKQAAEQAIRSAHSIIITSHVNPDGDAIGSILGTALTLAALGKHVLPINPDPVPWTFQKLPQASRVSTWDALASFGRPDLWLALDSADELRLGLTPDVQTVLADVPIVQFDHHITNTRYGQVNIVEPETAACCQQMARFLVDRDFPITADAATSLLCGLTTDSGGFRYSSVSAETFRAAADLMRCGGRQKDVGELLGRRRFSATKLWGMTLQTTELYQQGRVAAAYTTRAMFEAVRLGDEGTEGIVEALRAIEGVDIAITFREEPAGTVKVSFRTTEAVDATVLALANGGGGHPRAAGCTVAGPLEAARMRIIAQASYFLEHGTLPEPAVEASVTS
ncbi:MAG: bifunctional oligoribonuclease/PAP phosphatase NrnA [Chloroflexi bacterium]|nr:bifunctional oligoribonuclease/PAP phosphatase NrnA [Chloroflexota bacterium]